MGMLDKLGLGIKEKMPFKIPWEVQELRSRIETEHKENFPSLARYREIACDAERVSQLLNDIIAKKEYAEEATHIRDEMKSRVDGLGKKIKRNMQDDPKEVKEDYVAQDSDCPERKSRRNKEKMPFKIPWEVQELRSRIETEHKENFPGLARFKEIVSDVNHVSQLLQEMIAKKEHAEEAARIRDEIRAKLDALGDKIKRNMQDAQKDVKEDYVARNIDYLERKSYRNKAKTLFTVFLENVVCFERYCGDGSMEPGKSIEAVSSELFQAAADLQKGFFTKHGEDREIRAIKDDVLKKMSVIRALYMQSKQHFAEEGLASFIESQLQLMPAGVRRLASLP